jgi:acetoacetyl-CoA synthetase
MAVSAPDVLWSPGEERVERANLTRYVRWLGETRGLSFEDYQSLWRWSVEDLAGFWGSIVEFLDVRFGFAPSAVLGSDSMPGAEWFPGATINYAEHVFRGKAGERVAIRHASEVRPEAGEWSWDRLRAETAAVASGLRALGVGSGDRVAAYMPNIPETVAAMLACASLGAVWSSAAPEFGARSVIDRFSQIEPKVLLAIDGYRYGGRDFDRRAEVEAIAGEIPSLERVVNFGYLGGEGWDQAIPAASVSLEGAASVAREGVASVSRDGVASVSRDGDASANLDGDASAALEGVASANLEGVASANLEELPDSGPLIFEAVPFDHPLWVLYSSGTTGLPKPIVQGQGGILLEQLKKGVLHLDAHPGDRMFWFSTTGWMMWNFIVGVLLTEASIVLYDGNPGYPSMERLWDLAEETGMTCFGTSAAFVAGSMKEGVKPRTPDRPLAALRSVGSTGSPLAPEGFRWIYDELGPDLWLFSTSGGTDMCTAFVGGVPTLPVYEGELQGRILGASVESWDPDGRSLVDEVGELVITKPMPSMPLFFWGDEDGSRYHDSYFSMYPGVWRHGDWIMITSRGTAVIYGRSDSTINRGGVRMGTAEIYRAVLALDEVVDALVVDLPREGTDGWMPLFVVLRPGASLDDELVSTIRARIRFDVSPRHVPDEIRAIPEVPRTLSGKVLEVPVKRILTGTPASEAASRESLANPAALDYFVEMAAEL